MQETITAVLIMDGKKQEMPVNGQSNVSGLPTPEENLVSYPVGWLMVDTSTGEAFYATADVEYGIVPPHPPWKAVVLKKLVADLGYRKRVLKRYGLIGKIRCWIRCWR